MPGSRPGDRIETVDGRKVRTFIDLATAVALVAKGESADGRGPARRRNPDDLAPAGLRRDARHAAGALIAPVATLTIDDGVTEKLVIGPYERAVVSGRAVRGGAEFQSDDARGAGHRPGVDRGDPVGAPGAQLEDHSALARAPDARQTRALPPRRRFRRSAPDRGGTSRQRRGASRPARRRRARRRRRRDGCPRRGTRLPIRDHGARGPAGRSDDSRRNARGRLRRGREAARRHRLRLEGRARAPDGLSARRRLPRSTQSRRRRGRPLRRRAARDQRPGGRRRPRTS